MSLSRKQAQFTANFAKLVEWVNSQPDTYCVIGEVMRPEQMAALYAQMGVGIKDSYHLLKMAGDLLIFVNGVWRTESEDYRTAGEHWKSLHPLNRWGGDFTRPDGNHFEMMP